MTHTQAFVGEVAAGLAVWARVAARGSGRRLDTRSRVVAAADWAAPRCQALAAIALGTASLGRRGRGGLLLKEITRIPAEGAETARRDVGDVRLTGRSR